MLNSMGGVDQCSRIGSCDGYHYLTSVELILPGLDASTLGLRVCCWRLLVRMFCKGVIVQSLCWNVHADW